MERLNAMVETSKIRPFPESPFRVIDDAMHALVESIMLDGIHTPVVLRRIEEDVYEMISGHRRLFAAAQIGLDTIPAEVRLFSDEEAAIAMVDAGLQRKTLLPSEKAFAYKMRYDAMRRLATRSVRRKQSKEGKTTQQDILLAEEVGESRQQIHRYLRLVHVTPAIRDMVDRKAIALMTAVEISFLDLAVQEKLYEYMLDNDICMSYQLYALRDYIKDNGTISRMEMIRVLNESAPFNEGNRFQKITIRKEKLREYFPVFYTRSQMESVIFRLLENWAKENGTEG